MLERFSLRLLTQKMHNTWGAFPFTQGYCTQLSSELLNHAEKFRTKLVDKTGKAYLLRPAFNGDEKKLIPLLKEYGESDKNYGDLECFPEKRLPQIATNMAYCLKHGYFLSFLITPLEKPGTPIGFLQVDPYDLSTIESNFEQFFFPHINTFSNQPFDKPLLQQNSFNEIIQHIHRHTNRKKLCIFIEKITNFTFEKASLYIEPWIRLLEASFLSYETFKSLDTDLNGLMGNLSYGLLPPFQNQGIMSTALQALLSFIRAQNCLFAIFTDRISEHNTPSLQLMKKLNFEPSCSFGVYYNENYRTRHHPKGQFSEQCFAFIKE